MMRSDWSDRTMSASTFMLDQAPGHEKYFPPCVGGLTAKIPHSSRWQLRRPFYEDMSQFHDHIITH
jgi:hypothetical protein